MILVRNLRLAVGEEEVSLPSLAAGVLHIRREAIGEWKILRRSLDARKKNDIHWLYTLAVSVRGEETRLLRRADPKRCELYRPYVYEIPHVQSPCRPVVVGFGPAGMFAALVLAEAGLRPLVLERGRDVDTRRAQVERFWKTGELDPESNVQFGEGGAGTFSDGKLNTGTHDARIAWVLEQFHRFGAPESVCYDAKPHVGTDVLTEVVRRLRQHIEELGGEVRTGSRVTDIRMQDGAVSAVTVTAGEDVYTLPCRELILAVGHSARDTFALLERLGVPMERKPFSMGVRIEHAQAAIGRSQYGELRDRLPAADYKLNCRLPDGGSAYTFCMCPGGQVVAAASEAGGVVTNGMSYAARDGRNANAALLVTLEPEDFPGEGVLAGVEWQRAIERRAYAYGGNNYLAPAQTVGDFLARRPSSGSQGVEPTYRPGVVWGELREVLPAKITDTLAAALPLLGRKLAGFDAPEAVLTAPETRSSSPVRILRGEDRRSVCGFYPCGEGAGYAGGITSAAVDGMKSAEAVIAALREEK